MLASSTYQISIKLSKNTSQSYPSTFDFLWQQTQHFHKSIDDKGSCVDDDISIHSMLIVQQVRDRLLNVKRSKFAKTSDIIGCYATVHCTCTQKLHADCKTRNLWKIKMPRMTADLLVKCRGQAKRKRHETQDQFLRRITHLYCSEKGIEAIVCVQLQLASYKLDQENAVHYWVILSEHESYIILQGRSSYVVIWLLCHQRLFSDFERP